MGLIIDNFAGGGGASTGIELAIGRSPDIAINHDEAAILMHKTNHPFTTHYKESVWDIDIKAVTKGIPVDLAWFSPDCKHFSKAKGGKPVEKKIRGLAWIVLKWAGMVKPKVIILENVEEFQTWGPIRKGRPVKSKKGDTFNKWKGQLESLGYDVDHRELKACDYGAPTSRRRFFLIARCDGKPIVWPEPTHAPKDSLEVHFGIKKPYRAAHEIIDWSIPCKSIFERNKPLAENTLKRIARGLQKFVVENQEPFIVPIGYGEREGQAPRVNDLDKPLGTLVATNKHYLCTPYIIQYHQETSNNVRGQKLDDPILTIDGSPRYGLVSAFISNAGEGKRLKDHSEQVQKFMKKYYDKSVLRSRKITKEAFLIKYYGQGTGQDIKAPLDTVTSKDRFGLVTIKGEEYRIVDIGLRMLEPHELFAAQGFPSTYIINRDYKGNVYPKTKQVARCGNAVPPPFAKALVEANCSWLLIKDQEVI